MVFYLFLAGFLLVLQEVFPQKTGDAKVDQTESYIHDSLSHKIGSGELLRILDSKKTSFPVQMLNIQEKSQSGNNLIEIALYTDHYPSGQELNKLQNLGISVLPETWISPSEKHPYGFFVAHVPPDQIKNTISLDFIERIEAAEDLSFPQNNEAAKRIKADFVWNLGYKGGGIKIAVLDSGLDTDFSATEFPLIQGKDYSNYPALDDIIENTVTGHGTHVTGSLLSRGILSEENTANGTGPYRGIAPESELIFLKIGNDLNGGAKTSAITEALKAAVEIYNADVITMSYGSWDIYHDGSNLKDQAVDWCYSQGVPVFIPAGNDAENKRHFSGMLDSGDSTDFIRVNVTSASENSTYLAFNLVWSDGTERKNLALKYYNANFEELTNIYHWTATQSSRGTESKLSQSLFTASAGNNVYYLKVYNLSAGSQSFHLYEHYNDGKVAFENADPDYTIVSPATADHAFTVGSYVTRVDWVSYNGLVNQGSQEQLGAVYSFSGRGPRIDGLQKPDIVAPGSSIISLRDEDVYTVPNLFFVDNDGNTSGSCDYMVMEGTSMSAPFCAGAAALFLQKFPGAAPEEVYEALRNSAGSDEFTGYTASPVYGHGKLDIYAALLYAENPLPVELTSLNARCVGNAVEIRWSTATEMNNLGFEIEKKTEDKQKDNNNEWKKIGFIKGSGNSNSFKDYSFIDKELYGSGTYKYRLKQVDIDGSFTYSEAVEADVNSPLSFELQQNYPNPFNPETSFQFSIPGQFENGNELVSVTLKVYDMLGREVAEVISEEKNPGNYKVSFNASGLSSGTYFYKLQAGNFTSTKKMILLK